MYFSEALINEYVELYCLIHIHMLKTFEEDQHSKKIVAITPESGFSLGF